MLRNTSVRLVLLCSTSLAGIAAPQPSAEDVELFEARVRPVLARSCYSCHGPANQFSNLRVDSRESLLAGGKRGPAITPSEPNRSLLLKAVRHDGLQMPPGIKLKQAEISAIEEWIRRGAGWPHDSAVAASSPAERYRRIAREHWAFQPVRKPARPLGNGQVQNPIDSFVLASLEKAGLALAPPTAKRTLIRRLSYVLTGLPPSADSVDRFVADASPKAYEQLVDSLLGSPHFGEHWARHWLDLVRYGETRGYEWNYEIIGAWRYRDYLIRAFNSDVPYDQFVREHIAGDLLERPRINVEDRINESVIGTAFYRLGEAGHDDCVMFREIALDVVDNQIDTLTKTFQGLTVSCSRCHDHKLDPIPSEDYYGLYSILNSSRPVTHTIDTAEVNAAPLDHLRVLKRAIRAELAAVWTKEAAESLRYLLATLPGGDRSGLTSERVEAWRTALDSSIGDLADPGNPWVTILCEWDRNRALFQRTAKIIADRYRDEAAVGSRYNSENFSALDINGWWKSGMGLREGISRDGEFIIATSGEQVVSRVLPAGIYSHLLSTRLNAALRSPDLPKNKKYLSLRVTGAQLGACRTVIDNCAIGEGNKILENDTLTWVKLDTVAAQERLPVFVELVTRWDNPRIPDRPGVLKPAQLKWIEEPRSHFGIAAAVLHDVDESPREELTHLLPLFSDGIPASWDQLAARYSISIRGAVERWAGDRATADDVRWLEWLVGNGLLTNSADASVRLQKLVEEYRKLEANLSEPRTVEGLADMSPGRDFPVLVGGGARNYGAPAPRRFLRYVFGDAALATSGSGRRELAELIASPTNPLTARVMVNRIWRSVFGRGLVPTVDNFGLIGDPPSHPELLDYLAATFVEQGWSVKGIIRLMVASSAFCQSTETTARAREADPDNALLHHYPVRRLEAESVRDSILAVSGTLSPSMFGPSTHPYREHAKEYRRLFSGPLDGEGRRSIYLKVTRMEGTQFLETFDYPIPMVTRGARDVTNVPAQALAMLNDPFVIAQAEACARRLLERPADSIEGRIHDLFRRTLGRNPDGVELERFGGLAAELASLHQIPRDRLLNAIEVWKDVAHAVFNLKEFMYID
jgi:hypothetical protein